MNVTITERHCHVPASVIKRTEALISGLSKFEPRATHADVVWTEEKHSRALEVVIHVDGAGRVAAKGKAPDFRAALSQAVERAGRMLKDQRERRRDHQAPPLAEGIELE